MRGGGTDFKATDLLDAGAAIVVDIDDDADTRHDAEGHACGTAGFNDGIPETDLGDPLRRDAQLRFSGATLWPGARREPTWSPLP